SKKSLVRRWLSRSSLAVSIEPSWTSTATVDCSGSSAIVISPEKSVNDPRTLAIIMCRTLKPRRLCTGSMVHVPDGIGLAMAVLLCSGQQRCGRNNPVCVDNYCGVGTIGPMNAPAALEARWLDDTEMAAWRSYVETSGDL